MLKLTREDLLDPLVAKLESILRTDIDLAVALESHSRGRRRPVAQLFCGQPDPHWEMCPFILE